MSPLRILLNIFFKIVGTLGNLRIKGRVYDVKSKLDMKKQLNSLG